MPVSVTSTRSIAYCVYDFSSFFFLFACTVCLVHPIVLLLCEVFALMITGCGANNVQFQVAYMVNGRPSIIHAHQALAARARTRLTKSTRFQMNATTYTKKNERILRNFNAIQFFFLPPFHSFSSCLDGGHHRTWSRVATYSFVVLLCFGCVCVCREATMACVIFIFNRKTEQTEWEKFSMGENTQTNFNSLRFANHLQFNRRKTSVRIL